MGSPPISLSLSVFPVLSPSYFLCLNLSLNLSWSSFSPLHDCFSPSHISHGVFPLPPSHVLLSVFSHHCFYLTHEDLMHNIVSLTLIRNTIPFIKGVVINGVREYKIINIQVFYFLSKKHYIKYDPYFATMYYCLVPKLCLTFCDSID